MGLGWSKQRAASLATAINPDLEWSAATESHRVLGTPRQLSGAAPLAAVSLGLAAVLAVPLAPIRGVALDRGLVPGAPAPCRRGARGGSVPGAQVGGRGTGDLWRAAHAAGTAPGSGAGALTLKQVAGGHLSAAAAGEGGGRGWQAVAALRRPAGRPQTLANQALRGLRVLARSLGQAAPRGGRALGLTIPLAPRCGVAGGRPLVVVPGAPAPCRHGARGGRRSFLRRGRGWVARAPPHAGVAFFLL